jgi:hypothetical protein
MSDQQMAGRLHDILLAKAIMGMGRVSKKKRASSKTSRKKKCSRGKSIKRVKTYKRKCKGSTSKRKACAVKGYSKCAKKRKGSGVYAGVSKRKYTRKRCARGTRKKCVASGEGVRAGYSRGYGVGPSMKSKAHAKINPWIQFVREWAEENNMSYAEALQSKQVKDAYSKFQREEFGVAPKRLARRVMAKSGSKCKYVCKKGQVCRKTKGKIIPYRCGIRGRGEGEGEYEDIYSDEELYY